MVRVRVRDYGIGIGIKLVLGKKLGLELGFVHVLG